jgi:hypothetical protein
MEPLRHRFRSILILAFGVMLAGLGIKAALDGGPLGMFLGTGLLLVGVPILVAAVVLFRRERPVAPRQDETQGIDANEAGGVSVALWAAAIVNCLTLPGTWMVWRDGEGTGMPPVLRFGVPALVASVGLVLALFALHRATTYHRLGAARLLLVPPHPCLGQLVQGTVKFAGAARYMPSRWRVTLKCEMFRATSDTDGERGWIGKVIWSRDWEATTTGNSVPLQFVPGDAGLKRHAALPSKERDEDSAVYWTVEMLSPTGLRHYRSFTLTVLAPPSPLDAPAS